MRYAEPEYRPLPSAGLTSTAAIDLGSRLLGSRSVGPMTIQSATIGRLAAYAIVEGVDPQTPVWALTYAGAFADRSSCLASAPATPCLGVPTALLVIDFTTGAELALRTPAPPG